MYLLAPSILQNFQKIEYEPFSGEGAWGFSESNFQLLINCWFQGGADTLEDTMTEISLSESHFWL